MELLQLEVDGHIIPLPSGQVVTFIDESPVYSTEINGGEYSLPFKIPVTPLTNSLFGYASVPTARIPQRVTKAARVLIGSSVWKEGLLTVKAADSRQYQAYFQSGISSAIADVIDKPLNEQTFPSYSFADARAEALAKANSLISYDYYFFPVAGGSYSSNPAWSGVINQYDIITDTFVQNSLYSTPGEYEFETVLTPFPRLSRVCKHLFEGLGYSFRADILDDDDVRRMCIITNNSLMEQINDSGSYRVVGKTSFNLADFLPSMTVGDFLFEVNLILGCSFSYDEPTRTVTMTRRTEFLADTNIYEVKGKLWSVNSPIEGMTDLAFEYSDTKDGYVPYTKGELVSSQIVIPQMKISTSQRAYITSGANNTYSIIPEIDFSINSKDLEENNGVTDKLVLAIYNGIENSNLTNGNSSSTKRYGYPQAHTYRYTGPDFEFTHWSGNLDWEGQVSWYDKNAAKTPNGVYFQRWEEWTEFQRQARPIELWISPTSQDMVSISKHRKVRVENHTVLIKEVETQVNGSLAQIKVSGYLM